MEKLISPILNECHRNRIRHIIETYQKPKNKCLCPNECPGVKIDKNKHF